MIQLFPYSKVEGVWSLPDEALADAFYKTADQGSINEIFWDGKIQSPEEFINYFKSPRNLPVFVFKDTVPCGYAWINNIGMSHAHSHFCVFKEFWGSEHKKEIFESVMTYWFGFKDGDRNLFETLIGMIPKFNTHAMRYVKENGFKLVGEIPNMVNDVFSKQKFPIVIFYRSR
jgi:hypothetical protein